MRVNSFVGMHRFATHCRLLKNDPKKKSEKKKKKEKADHQAYMLYDLSDLWIIFQHKVLVLIRCMKY